MQQPAPVEKALALYDKAREADTLEARKFIAVNETRMLCAYHQAVLWLGNKPAPACLSGVAAPEKSAPYTQWLTRLFPALSALTEARSIGPDDVPPGIGEGWSDWLPDQVLWVPFPGGGMLFARAAPAWRGAEFLLLRTVVGLYAAAFAAPLKAPSRRRFNRGFGLAAAALVLVIAAMTFVRVPLTVLAPAAVVATDAVSVRAPIAGVVARVMVKPNQNVAAGEVLFELDAREIDTELELARSEETRSQAEYEQERQRALKDPQARLRLAELASAIEQQQARILYLQTRRAEITVLARRAGVVVMNDASEWIGRPVNVGEEVMKIADPASAGVEGWISAAEVIPLDAGAPVRLFLNASPLTPYSASLDYMVFDAAPRPDGTIAHRLSARFAPGTDLPRLGLEGTLRVSGERVSLAYWLFRRPISVMRRITGL